MAESLEAALSSCSDSKVWKDSSRSGAEAFQRSVPEEELTEGDVQLWRPRSHADRSPPGTTSPVLHTSATEQQASLTLRRPLGSNIMCHVAAMKRLSACVAAGCWQITQTPPGIKWLPQFPIKLYI